MEEGERSSEFSVSMKARLGRCLHLPGPLGMCPSVTSLCGLGGGGGDGGGSGQDWACHTQGSAGDREKCSGPKLGFQFPVQTLLPTLVPEEAPG